MAAIAAITAGPADRDGHADAIAAGDLDRESAIATPAADRLREDTARAIPFGLDDRRNALGDAIDDHRAVGEVHLRGATIAAITTGPADGNPGKGADRDG